MSIATITGLLLIVVPLAFNLTFFLLQRGFDYPDILRQPTETILQRFKQGGAPLRRLWYAFTFSAVLFTPVPVLVQQVFEPDAPWFLVVGTVIGVLAGVVQFLGLMRWPFLVPSLAELSCGLSGWLRLESRCCSWRVGSRSRTVACVSR